MPNAKSKFAGTAFVCLLLAAGGAFAQPTQYVTDQLEITLRTGTSSQHKILRMLDSGTRLTVLETDSESGYSRVRTPSGEEGWVITRYLLDQPVARDRLAEAEATIKKLRDQQKNATSQLSELSDTRSDLAKKTQRLETENKKLEQDLNRIRQTAANALSLESENQSLKKRLFQLERENQLLDQQNEALQDRSARDWFVAGAAVIILGMVLGLIVPKISVKRKSSWSKSSWGSL